MSIVVWVNSATESITFLDKHSGELTILILGALLVVALLVVVPQLLRARQQASELLHQEYMQALERGQSPGRPDSRSVFAGRTATLVPMVVVCAAATVTCFLAGYKSDSLFSVALAIWSVAGVVSLAAITGGVALMGRLAQLSHGTEEEEVPENPLQGP